MKILATVSLMSIFLVFTSCGGGLERKVKELELKESEFYDPVKKVTTYSCEEYWVGKQPLEIVKSSCNPYLVQDFSREGILINDVFYDTENQNKVKYSVSVKLNENGRVVEELSINHPTLTYNGSRIRRTYSYNKDGFITESAIFRDRKLDRRTVDEYDDYNCVSKSSHFDSENRLKVYSIYTYTEFNKEKTKVVYDENGEEMRKYIYEYNDLKERISQFKESKRKDKLTDYEEIGRSGEMQGDWADRLPKSFDKNVEHYPNGGVKSWHFINGSGKDVYQAYDNAGRIVERKFEINGTWLETETWKFRDDGALMEKSNAKSTLSVGGEKIPYYKVTVHYKLDAHGNWVESYIVNYDGSYTGLSVRVIEYY